MVMNFLKENGASFFNDISEGTGLLRSVVETALRELTLNSLVSCDDYNALLNLISGNKINASAGNKIDPVARRQQRRMSRAQLSGLVMQRVKLQGGRWYLLGSFSVMGKKLLPEKLLERQCALLLQRYGILVKDWYRQESGFLPWYPLFQHLKRMEWQDRLQRGYFISGLPGLQFALPEAVQILSNLSAKPNTTVLSLSDPALPLGKNVPWQIPGMENVSVSRLPINHLFFVRSIPVAYGENYSTRLWFSTEIDNVDTEVVCELIKNWLRLPAEFRARPRIQIEEINGKPASKSPVTVTFISLGFERDQNSLVLWPSAVS